MRKNILLAVLMAVAFHFNVWAATEIEKHWNCDPYLYPHNMTIVGVVEIDEAEQGNTSLEVGAFCGTECRGSEMLHYFPQVNRFLVFLTVYGEDNDSINFKLYDHGTEEELDAYVEGMTFEINAMHGLPTDPYEFNFIPYYNATVAANPTEAGTVTGGGHYLAHEAVTLSATPNTGWNFVNWTEDGEVMGTETTFQFEIVDDRSLVANFEMIMHHVDVGVNYEVAGSAAGAGDYQEGTTVTVSATANTGFHFDRWTENGETVSTSASYAFAIWEDRNLTAEFQLDITDTTAFSCVEYDWHGQNYTSSGVYYDTLTSQLGMDSIVALHLTIYPAYAYNLYETACDSFLWNDIYYYESGDYEDAHQSIHGCDSIYTLHLTINQTRPLGNFTYMTPANNYINRYTDVDFYWDGVVNANQYDFYFWEDGNDRPTNPTIANSVSVTAHRDGLEHGITYHWCVVAKNECVEMESPERTFVCQLTPAMSVLPQGTIDFGEVEVGQSSTKNISVSGTALPEDISYTFLQNINDTEFFTISPSSNWNNLKGGTLHVTFTPVADQLYYSSAIRIASGSFVDTVYFTGSMANRYVFTTQVEDSRSQFIAGDSIVINGHVEDVLGNVVPNLDVDVYLMVMGTRTTKRTVSDENGDYSITYVPRYSESGYYQVGSCEKNKPGTEIHDDFDVPGMSRTTSDYIIWELYQNDTLTGSIPIRNRSRIPLGSIQVIPVTVPNGLEISFESFSLDALETGELNYSLTGTEVSTGNSYQEATFQLLANDGTMMNMTCYYYCLQRFGDLDVYPSSVVTSMKRYGQKVLSFQVTNNGNAETGTISVDLPDVPWMRMMGSDTLPSLAVGDSLLFSLILEPDENVPMGSFTGNFAVNCAYGDGISVPYSIITTSDSTGALVVDVTDDYTYNTNEGFGPHLAGASVFVEGFYSLETVAHGYTDEQGIFRLDTIPEGYYYLTVRADYHSEYNKGVIFIEGGKTNTQLIYLQFQPISYSWDVVPTEVEDEYEFTLVTTIKTNVPVPVVTIEGLSTLDTLAYGDTIRYNLTVTNYGLVDAYDTQLIMPDIGDYVFTPTIDCIDTLHPHTSIVVPCILTRVRGNRNRDDFVDPTWCQEGYFKSISWYHCNAQRKWIHHVSKPIRIKLPEIFCQIDYFEVERILIETAVDISKPIRSLLNHLPSRGYTTSSNLSWPVTTASTDCTPCWKVVAEVLTTVIDEFTPIPVSALFNLGVNISERFIEKIDFYSNTVTNFEENPINTTFKVGQDVRDCYEIYSFGQSGVSEIQHINQTIPEYSSDDYLNLKHQLSHEEWNNSQNYSADIKNLNRLLNASNIVIDLMNCIRIDGIRESSEIDVAIDQIEQSFSFYQSFMNEITNVFQEEEWLEEKFVLEFMDSFMTLVDSTNGFVSMNDAQQLYEAYDYTTVNDSIIQRFVERWNRSIQYWNEDIFTLSDLPDGYDNNFIKLDNSLMTPAVDALESLTAYGYDDIGEMFHQAMNVIYAESKKHSTDVCAKISVEFKQTMAMTREAFEGTLRITNGHMTDPMQDIAVNLTIKNPSGEDCTDLFQINTTSMSQITGIDGTGSLNAQTEGVVQFMMIPTIAAAPEEPAIYSFGGSFTFLDPFSGEEMTYQLYPVELTVNPSPNLYIDYFVQRNIISDDPLTEDTIEPMEEAEIAMMIRNMGAGDAKNVYLESSQPEIIDNQNNLLIEFNMTGSAMNGERRPLGLTDIPFGTITGHTNGIAEWYFTSSLIGRVINSTARVIHNNSYGNPQLSLVSAVNTHELIKAVSAYGALDDGINDFLVNEISDFGHIPDKLYFSNGDTTNVIQADSLRALDSVTHLNHTVVMQMYPHAAGWNYGTVEDPGGGRYELVSCTRNDGQEIPLNNVWITHITIPHDDVPIHENILHIVDTLSTGDMVSYTLVYDVELYCDVTVTVNPEEGGTATGGGHYDLGESITLEAIPNEGYSFVSWTEADTIVSTEPTFNIMALTDRDFVANFSLNTYQITATTNSSEWGTVTGGGTYSHGSTCTLTATPTEGYVFIKWTKDGEVVSTEPTYSFTVTEEGNYVGYFGWYVEQAFSFRQGWNWWSTYIDMSGDLLTQLEDSLGTDGVIIKSRYAYVTNDEGTWFGGLNHLDNQYMYMILTENPLDFSLSGALVNLSEVNVNLSSGWNWMGNPLSVPMPLEEAIANLDPDDGDIIKSFWAFSSYDDEEEEWFGNLITMVPGIGYMYYAERSHSFYYIQNRNHTDGEPPVEYHWIANPHAYAENMSIIAVVHLDGEELNSGDYEIAAYANGKCLGSTRLKFNNRRQRHFALIPVSGEKDMQVTFRLYDVAKRMEYHVQADETFGFVENDVLGSLNNPVVLHFNTGVQESTPQLHLYPNPTRMGQEVCLSLPEANSVSRVEIYNVLNMLVSAQTFTGNTFRLSEAVLPGTYAIKVFVDNTVYYGKLIVN